MKGLVHMQDGLCLKQILFGRKNFRVIICLNLGDSFLFSLVYLALHFYSKLKIKMNYCKRQSSFDNYLMSSYPFFDDNFDDIVCRAI